MGKHINLVVDLGHQSHCATVKQAGSVLWSVEQGGDRKKERGGEKYIEREGEMEREGDHFLGWTGQRGWLADSGLGGG